MGRDVNVDDHELIAECLAGQPEAFSQLVIRHQDRLHNSLLRMLGSRDDALEVAQDAFVHAFQKLGSFRGESAFYSWLFRIAFNAAISRKRKVKRKTTSLDTIKEASGAELTDENRESRPSHQMELNEERDMVRQALDELPEDYRTVIVMKEIEQMRYDEIADLLNCPVGTVRSRLHRARNELRTKLTRILSRQE